MVNNESFFVEVSYFLDQCIEVLLIFFLSIDWKNYFTVYDSFTHCNPVQSPPIMSYGTVPCCRKYKFIPLVK